jgi:predicted anti-sigma-YlaC factor YlaD
MSGIETSANGNESPEREKESVLEENLKSRATWVRALYMVVFCFLFAIVEIVLVAVVVIQFVWRLAKGFPNQPLLELGQGLGSYLYQIVGFLTFNTEELPFPFDGDWPPARSDD